jgi:hypothetical protein
LGKFPVYLVDQTHHLINFVSELLIDLDAAGELELRLAAKDLLRVCGQGGLQEE